MCGERHARGRFEEGHVGVTRSCVGRQAGTDWVGKEGIKRGVEGGVKGKNGNLFEVIGHPRIRSHTREIFIKTRANRRRVKVVIPAPNCPKS